MGVVHGVFFFSFFYKAKKLLRAVGGWKEIAFPALLAAKLDVSASCQKPDVRLKENVEREY